MLMASILPDVSSTAARLGRFRQSGTCKCVSLGSLVLRTCSSLARSLWNRPGFRLGR